MQQRGVKRATRDSAGLEGRARFGVPASAAAVQRGSVGMPPEAPGCWHGVDVSIDSGAGRSGGSRTSRWSTLRVDAREDSHMCSISEHSGDSGARTPTSANVDASLSTVELSSGSRPSRLHQSAMVVRVSAPRTVRVVDRAEQHFDKPELRRDWSQSASPRALTADARLPCAASRRPRAHLKSSTPSSRSDEQLEVQSIIEPMRGSLSSSSRNARALRSLPTCAMESERASAPYRVRESSSVALRQIRLTYRVRRTAAARC